MTEKETNDFSYLWRISKQIEQAESYLPTRKQIMPRDEYLPMHLSEVTCIYLLYILCSLLMSHTIFNLLLTILEKL